MKQAMSAIRKRLRPGQVQSCSRSSASAAHGGRQAKSIERRSIILRTYLRKNFIVYTCCNPLPGDDVFGYVTEKERWGAQRSCQTGLKLKSNFGNRIIAVEWGDYRQYSFLHPLSLRVSSRRYFEGYINKSPRCGHQYQVNVVSNDGIFEGVFNLHVHSAEEVSALCGKIAKVDGVSTVHRSTV